MPPLKAIHFFFIESIIPTNMPIVSGLLANYVFEKELIKIKSFEIELFQLDLLTNRVFGMSKSILKNQNFLNI